MIDWTKPVQTVDGRQVNIWTTDAKCYGCYTVVGEVKTSDGWSRVSWTVNGKFNAIHHSAYDLINIPQRHTYWLNVYKNAPSRIHESRDAADAAAWEHRIACIKIEYEEGEGL